MIRPDAVPLLLELQVRSLHHVGKRLNVAVDARAEFVRRTALRKVRDAADALANARVGERLLQRRLEFLAIGSGEPATRNAPIHCVFRSTSPRPASASVGVSGNSGIRLAAPTASARTLLPCAIGTTTPESGNANSVCPPTTLSTISLVERYGIG